MTYAVAIPTFNRPEVLARRTLSTLARGGVPAGRVTLFLGEHDPQLSTNLSVAREFGVGTVVLPLRGIHATRLHIVNEAYAAGTAVLQMDDDVHGLLYHNGTKKLAPVTDLDRFITRGFARTREAGLYAWGVAPVPNHFFMTPKRWTAGLRFLIGTFTGQIVRPGHPVHRMGITLKEDYETSLRHYWYDGAVLRADGVSVKADHYTPGGCAGYRSHDAEEAAVRTLLAAWPGYVRRNGRRSTPEVVLSAKARGPARPPSAPLPGVSL